MVKGVLEANMNESSLLSFINHVTLYGDFED